MTEIITAGVAPVFVAPAGADGKPITNYGYVAALAKHLAENPDPKREIAYGLVTTPFGMTEYRPLGRFGLDPSQMAADGRDLRVFVCGNLTARRRVYKEVDRMTAHLDVVEGTIGAGYKLMDKQTGAFPGFKMRYQGGRKILIPIGVMDTTPAAPLAPAVEPCGVCGAEVEGKAECKTCGVEVERPETVPAPDVRTEAERFEDGDPLATERAEAEAAADAVVARIESESGLPTGGIDAMAEAIAAAAFDALPPEPEADDLPPVVEVLPEYPIRRAAGDEAMLDRGYTEAEVADLTEIATGPVPALAAEADAEPETEFFRKVVLKGKKAYRKIEDLAKHDGPVFLKGGTGKAVRYTEYASIDAALEAITAPAA